MTLTVKDVDKETWRRFAAYCKLKNTKVGKELTDLLSKYLESNFNKLLKNKKAQLGHLSIILAGFLIVFMVGLLVFQKSTITGLAIFSDCGGTNGSGYYDLNGNLNCDGSGYTAITFNKNDTELNCMGYTITGDGAGGLDTIVINSVNSNFTIRNCTLTSGRYNLRLMSSDNIIIRDSSITSGSTKDINVTNSINNTFLNVTFSTVTVGSNSNFSRQWYLEIQSNWSNGTVIPYANVTAFNSTSGTVSTMNFTGTANATGFLRLNVTEYINNGGTFINYSGYNVSATDGTNTNSSGAIINMSTNRLVNIVVGVPAAASNTPPATPLLAYPLNNSQINNTQLINFTFNVTDAENSTLNCSLFIDSAYNASNTTTLNNTMTNFTISLSYGYHNYSINCSDSQYINSSQAYYFSINDTIAPSWSNNLTNATLLKTNQTVYFSINVSDNLALNYSIFSFDNGTGALVNETAIPLNLTASIKINITKQITAAKGQNISWTWYANDSSNNWNQTTVWNLTIQNTAPTHSTPLLNSSMKLNKTNETLQCFNQTTNDVDADAITNKIRWLNNSAAIASLENLTSIGHGNTTKGQNWTCEVTPYDGTDYGTALNSSILTIANAAPILNASIPDKSWSEAGAVTINLSLYFKDIDNDDMNYSSTTPSDISVSIDQTTNIATLTAIGRWYGEEFITFNATDSSLNATSNNATLNVANAIRCGDGNKEGSEECDDSNTNSGDGCSASCAAESGGGGGSGGGGTTTQPKQEKTQTPPTEQPQTPTLEQPKPIEQPAETIEQPSDEQAKDFIEEIIKITDPSMALELVSEKTNEIINKYFETSRNVKINRTFEYNETENSTIIRLRITPEKKLYNFSLYEKIPKCIALLIKAGIKPKGIEFYNSDYEVINEDPLIMWHFDVLEEPTEIGYKVDKKLLEDCEKLLIALGIAEKIEGVTEEKPAQIKKPNLFANMMVGLKTKEGQISLIKTSSPILVVLLLIYAIIFFSKFQPAPEHHVKKLAEWIKKAHEKGLAPKHTRKILKKAGWPSHTIHHAHIHAKRKN
ncbi:MAG: myxococcus cysteine-rich repeat containing protein [Candidatus Woesearchaeota archaeon]|nr:myxococcus cysteine-rich repeat containing protein [Candidatus Woesearchaeota archaeon]